MTRVRIVPGMLTRSSAPRDADTPSEPSGEEGSEGGQTALEWLEAQTAHIWRMWGQRYKDGKDW